MRMGRQSIVRMLVGLIAVASAWPLVIAGRAFVYEYRSFEVGRRSSDLARAQAEFPRLEAFTLPSGKDRVAAWYLPGTRRAAVIVAHGYGAVREDMMPEIRILQECGIGVLAFDWPGQGESTGRMLYGAPEIGAVRAAVDYIARRPDVDPARIGAYGFSMGGYLLAQSAASDPRIAALAVGATMPSLQWYTNYEYAAQGRLAQWAARVAGRLRGSVDEPESLEERMKTFKRPLLVVAGERDAVVPAWAARRLHDHAAGPREWLLISGAEHGGYATLAGSNFAGTLGRFFTAALRLEAPPAL